jgi:hypothetical protein
MCLPRFLVLTYAPISSLVIVDISNMITNKVGQTLP